MSLESKIEELILAINANTAALEGRIQTKLSLEPSESPAERSATVTAGVAEIDLAAALPEPTKRTRRTKAEIEAAKAAEAPATNATETYVEDGVVRHRRITLAPPTAEQVEIAHARIGEGLKRAQGTAKAGTPKVVSADDLRALGHAIIDARRAKNLAPFNGPIKALNAELGIKLASDAAGTPLAETVFARLQQILKEVA